MREASDDPSSDGEASSAQSPESTAELEGLRERFRAEIAGPLFGVPFFGTVLRDRLGEHCSGIGSDTPQVLLHLADGSLLDICHITELAPRWISVTVFRDERSCDRMDLEFVPYQLITRVTLSSRPADERQLGFNVEGSQAAWRASAAQRESRHDPST